MAVRLAVFLMVLECSLVDFEAFSLISPIQLFPIVQIASFAHFVNFSRRLFDSVKQLVRRLIDAEVKVVLLTNRDKLAAEVLAHNLDVRGWELPAACAALSAFFGVFLGAAAQKNRYQTYSTFVSFSVAGLRTVESVGNRTGRQRGRFRRLDPAESRAALRGA